GFVGWVEALRNPPRDFRRTKRPLFHRKSCGGLRKASTHPTNPKTQRTTLILAGSTRSTPTRFAVFLQPREDFVVPVFAVFRLQNPVAFVGEVDELRRHVLALQGGEQLVALSNRATEIVVVVDNQHWRFVFA